jgi:hypothetical protein
MSGRYDKIKTDVAFRKDVHNTCGVGFEIPTTLGSIEPVESKFLEAAKEELAVTA